MCVHHVQGFLSPDVEEEDSGGGGRVPSHHPSGGSSEDLPVSLTHSGDARLCTLVHTQYIYIYYTGSDLLLLKAVHV